MICQHLSLTYCIPLAKDQSSFYEIRSLAFCINLIGHLIGLTENDCAYLEYGIFCAFWNMWTGEQVGGRGSPLHIFENRKTCADFGEKGPD